jgi:small subunit ribosomal protein S15
VGVVDLYRYVGGVVAKGAYKQRFALLASLPANPDVRSNENEIIWLSERISELREPRREYFDEDEKRELFDLITKRRRLLHFLKRSDEARYAMLIEQLETIEPDFDKIWTRPRSMPPVIEPSARADKKEPAIRSRSRIGRRRKVKAPKARGRRAEMLSLIADLFDHANASVSEMRSAIADVLAANRHPE